MWPVKIKNNEIEKDRKLIIHGQEKMGFLNLLTIYNPNPNNKQEEKARNDGDEDLSEDARLPAKWVFDEYFKILLLVCILIGFFFCTNFFTTE